MRRRLALLNIALVALIGLTAWRIWVVHTDAQNREEATLGQTPEPAEVPALPAGSAGQSASAASYFDIADKFLFSRDRNPTVVIEAAPEEPLPPLPVAHGVLDFGGGATAILTAPEADGQAGYRVGDKVGEFTLVEITPTDMAFEWTGGVVRRTLDQLRTSEVAEAPRRTAAAPRGSAPPPPVVAAPPKPAVSSSPSKGPSEIDMGGGIRACVPGDNSPAGTVVGGFRKVVSRSPFGQVCRWEPIE